MVFIWEEINEYEAGHVVSYGVVLSPSWYNVRHYSIVALGEDHKLRTFSYEEHFTQFISLERKPHKRRRTNC